MFSLIMLIASVALIGFSPPREEAETDPMSERLAKRIQEEFILRIMLMEWNWIVASIATLFGFHESQRMEIVFCLQWRQYRNRIDLLYSLSVGPVEQCV